MQPAVNVSKDVTSTPATISPTTPAGNRAERCSAQRVPIFSVARAGVTVFKRSNSISTARSCGVTWPLRYNLARRFRNKLLIQNVFHVIGSSSQLNKKTTNPAKRPNCEQYVQCFSLAKFCIIGTLSAIPHPTRMPSRSQCLPPNGEWLLPEALFKYCYWPIAALAVSRHCPKTNRFSTLTADVRPSPD